MRRRAIAISAILGGLLAAACSPASEPDPPEGALRVLIDPTRAAVLEPFIADFRTETGLPVEVLTSDYSRLPTTFTTSASDGEALDLVFATHDWAQAWAREGLIAPIPDQIPEVSLPAPLGSAFQVDSERYAVAIGFESVALVTNTDLVAVPSTWAELHESAQDFERESRLLIPMAGPVPDAAAHYPLQTSFGSLVLEGAGSCDAQALASGGDEFAAFLQRDAAALDGVLSSQLSAQDAHSAFVDGEAPFLVTTPGVVGDLIEGEAAVAVSPLPSAGGEDPSAFAVAQGFYLAADAAGDEDALALLQALTESEVQAALWEETRTPPADPTARERAAQDAATAGFIDVAEEGQALPDGATMAQVWTPLANTEGALVDGSATDPAAAWSLLVSDACSP